MYCSVGVEEQTQCFLLMSQYHSHSMHQLELVFKLAVKSILVLTLVRTFLICRRRERNKRS